MAARRPPVSVVVPFFGSPAQAERAVAAVRGLELGPADEIIVADNTPEQAAAQCAGGAVRHVDATQVRSSYYARNVGAHHARNDWLLFLDADTDPVRTLVDEYFRTAVGEDVGAVGGAVLASADQTGLIPRYSRSRGHVEHTEEHPHRPMAVTANLLVRRRAWAELGGFLEGIRSGGDADFSWRLQDAGWRLTYAPRAAVEHHHRESLKALLRQSARYGAGMRWLRRRHPGAQFDGRLRGLARCAAGILVWAATLRFERALFKGIDGAWIVAEAVGSLSSNAHREPAAADVVAIAEVFPDPAASSPAPDIAALRRGGRNVVIEADRRPVRPDWESARGLTISYAEDDGAALRFRDLTWLAATRPFQCGRDLISRPHGSRPLRELAPVARRIASSNASDLHAQGGGASETDAVRLGSLLGVTLTVSERLNLNRTPESLAGPAVAVDREQARNEMP